MFIPQLRSFGAYSGFLIDTCPLGTRRDKVTYYTALIEDLLWEAAWLWRDAIASYVCLCSCKLQFIGEIIHELAVTNIGGCNSQLNNSKSQAKPRIIQNSKFKIPNSSALPPKTIFAFLTLNTASSAHNKIFGAKFLSFERLEIMCLYTVCYAVFWRSAMKSDSQTSRFLLQ